MITQKQIDARDKYIAEFEECIGRRLSEEDEDALTEKRQLVHDANKEAAGMKNEMLDMIIHQYRWVKSLYDLYKIDERAHPDSDLIKTERDLRELIERATGLTIDEALKAWEEDHNE